MKRTIHEWCKVHGLDALSTSMLCQFARRAGIYGDTCIEERVFDALVVVFIGRVLEH